MSKEVFKRRLWKVVLAGSVLWLSGCLQTRSEIKEAEERNVAKDQVAMLQKERASNENRYQTLLSDLREFDGRIEASEHKVELLRKEYEFSREQEKQELKAISDKLAALEQAMGVLDKNLEKLQQAKSASAAEKKSEADKGPYTTAEEAFAKKDWKKAILNYQHYLERWPKGKFVPEATYKIGVCFQELGSPTDAKVFFEEITTKYPESPRARSAQTRLKSLKASR